MFSQCCGNAFRTDQARDRQIAVPEFAQFIGKKPTLISASSGDFSEILIPQGLSPLKKYFSGKQVLHFSPSGIWCH